MNDNINKKRYFRKYYRNLIRRKYIIMLPFITILSLSILYAFYQKPLYESSTTILIGKPKLMSEKLSRIATQIDGIETFDNLKREMLSHKNLIEIIKKLNLKENDKVRSNAKAIQLEYPDLSLEKIMEKLLIEKLKKQINVISRGKNSVTITAKGDDRDYVYSLVKTVSELFMNQIIEYEYESINQLAEFNIGQLKIYDDKLKESEAKLKQYEQLLNINPKESSSTSSKPKLEQYNSMLYSLEEEITQKRAELNEIDLKLEEKGYNSNFPTSRNLINLASQYITTGKKLSNDMNQFRLTNVDDLWLDEKISVLRQQLIGEIRNIARSKLSIKDEKIFQLVVLKEIMKRDFDVLKKISYKIIQLIEKYKDEIAQKQEQEVKIAKLRREVAVTRNIYNTFLEQSQGLFIGEELQRLQESYKFKIIEPASKPIERANSRKKTVFIGCFLAALVSFALFSLFEYLDDSFTDLDEIEKYLQLPVIGTVSKLNYFANFNNKIILYLAIPTIIIIFCLYIFIR